MMFKTHLAIGLLTSLFLLSDLKPLQPILFVAFFCFGAVLPDIDYPKTKVGREFGFISKILNFLFEHRGFMHTIFPPLILFAFSVKAGFPHIGFAMLLGYFVHIITDSLTYSGVKIFYPLLNFKVQGFFKTGGLFEYSILFVVSIFTVLKIWGMIS